MVRAAGVKRAQNRNVWQLMHRQIVALGLENGLVEEQRFLL